MKTKAKEEYYVFSKRPNWVDSVTNDEIKALSKETPKIVDMKDKGKGFSPLRLEIVNTSESKNQNYILAVWNLSNPEILQGASINEVILRETDVLELHRIEIIRDGKIIDKKDDLKIRVLDDEASSSQGSINKNKKVHIVVSNLQLEDTLIWEQTVTTTFSEDQYLDKKYFRYVHHLPSGYWFYGRYQFKLLQNRKDPVLVKQRYFRDAEGMKLPEESFEIKYKDIFDFRKEEYILYSKQNEFEPTLEVSTLSSWKEISTFVESLYKNKLYDLSIKESEVFKRLKLDSNEEVDSKIRSIIEYVQDNIIYIFDADVMHGHIPQGYKDTLATKSGDCKGKSLLLVNLLVAIGIESDFVLVNYGMDYYIPSSLPSPFLFDHAIVRIKYKDEYYFVDPTWSNRKGILGKRAEPFLANYLVVGKSEDLSNRQELDLKDIRLEEDIVISVKKDSNTIEISEIYRKELADIVRNDFKRSNIANILETKNRKIINSFEFPLGKEEDVQKYLPDSKIEVGADDHNENTITVAYKAKLAEPFAVDPKERVIKYYNSINYSELQEFNHVDAFCNGFIMYPQKTTLTIESDLYIKKGVDVTKSSLTIDNKYMYYSNKKDISTKKIIVVSEFLPKITGNVEKEDIQKMIENYKKINTSNFGTGVMLQYAVEYYWIMVVAFVVLLIILRLLFISGN